MPSIHSETLPNGLPLHRVEVPGTRAVTVLVAFEAGARTERPEENGMAHFLEHLVFKGGEVYDDYRKVNETAEQMGAMLNAYTSHDVVAFHLTCRAEVVDRAIDLLTDFVGRPKIDADELNRERGVVVQEIARSNDQPSVVAEHLIDRAAFGDHPLGRPVLGPAEHIRVLHARRDRRLPQPPVGGRARRRLPGRQPRARARRRRAGRTASAASRRSRRTARYEPAPPFTPQTLVEARDSNQSHLRISYRPEIDPADREQRAALSVYSTLLGGSMGSRLFDEIREQRGLAYSVYSVDHAFADVPILQLSAGLDSAKCVEAYHCMRGIVDDLRENGPRAGGVRARPRLRGRPAACWRSRTRTPWRATRPTSAWSSARTSTRIRRSPRSTRRRSSA